MKSPPNPTAIDRRAFIKTAALAGAGLALSRAQGALAAGAATPSANPQSAFRNPQSKRPNILFITTDDLGLQLSCYGDPNIKTPNFDALANSGVRFATAYVTQANCSPARASLLTGLYPHTNGQIGLQNEGFSMPRDNTPPTLPTLLARAGYRTGLMGKLHVSPEPAFTFTDDIRKNFPPEKMRDVRAVAAGAGAFFRRDPGKPFFLYLNYADPHKDQKVTPSIFPAQVNGIPEKPFKPGDIPPWPFQQVESPKVLEHIANYYNCAQRVDTGLGLLLDELKNSGHADDTIVVYIADHGPPFARAKTSCYEAGLHEALLIRWPGVSKPGLVSAAMVSSVDIMPTLLEAAGVPLPKLQHGRTLRPLLQGDTTNKRAYLAAEFHAHGREYFAPTRAIRDDRYKLIHNPLSGRMPPKPNIDTDAAPAVALSHKYDGTPAQEAMRRLINPPPWELYDLQTDPNEFKNLADDPAYRDILTRLQNALAQWQAETDDPYRDPAKIEATLADFAKRNAANAPSAKTKKTGKTNKSPKSKPPPDEN